MLFNKLSLIKIPQNAVIVLYYNAIFCQSF